MESQGNSAVGQGLIWHMSLEQVPQLIEEFAYIGAFVIPVDEAAPFLELFPFLPASILVMAVCHSDFDVLG